MSYATIVYGVIVDLDDIMPELNNNLTYEKLDDIVWNSPKYRDHITFSIAGYYEGDNQFILSQGYDSFLSAEDADVIELKLKNELKFDTRILEEFCEELKLEFKPKWYLFASEG